MGKLFVAFLLASALCSCLNDLNPRGAAEGYLKALARLDFDTAAQYVADGGKSNLQTLKNLYTGLDTAERKKFVVTDWTVTAESESGDTATVDFLFDKVKKGQLSLHRVGGVWRIESRTTF